MFIITQKSKEILIEERDYIIKRERKEIYFEDTNEIDVKTTYIIDFIKELSHKNEYILETPYHYFRIPEELSDKALIFKLNNDNPEFIVEKIIWYYIFEEVYGNANNEWTTYRNKLKQYLFESNLEEELKNFPEKPKITEDFIANIEKLKIKEYIEREDKFLEILEYPYRKDIVKYHHNTEILDKNFIYSLLCLFSFWIFITWLFYPTLFSFNISLLIFFLLLLIFSFYQRKITIRSNYKDKLMKINDLKKKFENSIQFFLIYEKDQSKEVSDMKINNIRLYLDSHSEKLFRYIDDLIKLDVFKAIQDYKTFNPIKFEVYIENKRIYPIPTEYEGFFHKTKIPFIIKDNNWNRLFSLEVNTMEIIQKKRKLTNIKERDYQIKKKYNYLACISFILVILIFMILPFYNILNILLLLTYLLIFLSLFPKSYFYNSQLQNFSEESQLQKRFFGFFLNSMHKIYTIPISLRPDCSYYFKAHAPRFHRIKITHELKDLMMKKLNLKIPENLSNTIESFNIPRKLNMKGYDLEIDIEISLNQRLFTWIIGIIIMFGIMIFSGIFYLCLYFLHPELLIDEFQEFTNLRIILTFLTLLIGFFGRDFLGNVTKDLNRIGVLLISLSFIVGILYSVPIFLYLLKLII